MPITQDNRRSNRGSVPSMQRIPLKLSQHGPQCSTREQFPYMPQAAWSHCGRLLDDPERRAALLAALAGGSSRKAACGFAKINYVTFLEYVKLDTDFLEQVEYAEGTRAVIAAATIQLHGKADWRALAWYLERKYPDEWGRGASAALPDPANTAPLEIPIDLAALTDHEYATLKELVAKIDARLSAIPAVAQIPKVVQIPSNGNGHRPPPASAAS